MKSNQIAELRNQVEVLNDKVVRLSIAKSKLDVLVSELRYLNKSLDICNIKGVCRSKLDTIENNVTSNYKSKINSIENKIASIDSEIKNIESRVALMNMNILNLHAEDMGKHYE